MVSLEGWKPTTSSNERIQREQRLAARLRLATERLEEAQRERIWAVVEAHESGLSIRLFGVNYISLALGAPFGAVTGRAGEKSGMDSLWFGPIFPLNSGEGGGSTVRSILVESFD